MGVHRYLMHHSDKRFSLLVDIGLQAGIEAGKDSILLTGLRVLCGVTIDHM